MSALLLATSPFAAISGTGGLITSCHIVPNLASTLIVLPETPPQYLDGLRTEPAGVYRIEHVSKDGREIRLTPPLDVAAPGLAPPRGKYFHVRFSVSRPRFGSLHLGAAEVLLLDTRTQKALWDVDSHTAGPSLIGEYQRRWLVDKIADSPAPVLVIATSVNFTFDNEFSLRKRDSWTAFKWERDLIARAILARDKPVILLSGDLHTTAVRRLNSMVYEIICGAWSNTQAKNVASRADAAEVFGEAIDLLHVNSDDTAEHGYETHVSFLHITASGGVDLEILNTATDSVEFQASLVM